MSRFIKLKRSYIFDKNEYNLIQNWIGLINKFQKLDFIFSIIKIKNFLKCLGREVEAINFFFKYQIFLIIKILMSDETGYGVIRWFNLCLSLIEYLMSLFKISCWEVNSCKNKMSNIISTDWPTSWQLVKLKRLLTLFW